MGAADGPFLMSEALAAAIDGAARAVSDASYAMALTGAGVSVESGIPPFRGPGGLWTRYGEPPLDGYQRFLADPAAAWRERLAPVEPWAVGLRDTLAGAKPNVGHRALAELERDGVLRSVITQNIDDLHRQAGSESLLEIHGNYRLLRCIECHRRFEPDQIRVEETRLPPTCTRCGGIVKEDTVQFGEPIPPDVLRGCYSEVKRADCMLVVGTTATVYPAAEFPLEVLRKGGCVIEVNPHESELTPLASLSLRGPAGAVLERLLRSVRLRAREEEA